MKIESSEKFFIYPINIDEIIDEKKMFLYSSVSELNEFEIINSKKCFKGELTEKKIYKYKINFSTIVNSFFTTLLNVYEETKDAEISKTIFYIERSIFYNFQILNEYIENIEVFSKIKNNYTDCEDIKISSINKNKTDDSIYIGMSILSCISEEIYINIYCNRYIDFLKFNSYIFPITNGFQKLKSYYSYVKTIHDTYLIYYNNILLTVTDDITYDIVTKKIFEDIEIFINDPNKINITIYTKKPNKTLKYLKRVFKSIEYLQKTVINDYYLIEFITLDDNIKNKLLEYKNICFYEIEYIDYIVPQNLLNSCIDILNYITIEKYNKIINDMISINPRIYNSYIKENTYKKNIKNEIYNIIYSFINSDINKNISRYNFEDNSDKKIIDIEKINDAEYCDVIIFYDNKTINRTKMIKNIVERIKMNI